MEVLQAVIGCSKNRIWKHPWIFIVGGHQFASYPEEDRRRVFVFLLLVLVNEKV